MLVLPKLVLPLASLAILVWLRVVMRMEVPMVSGIQASLEMCSVRETKGTRCLVVVTLDVAGTAVPQGKIKGKRLNQTDLVQRLKEEPLRFGIFPEEEAHLQMIAARLGSVASRELEIGAGEPSGSSTSDEEEEINRVFRRGSTRGGQGISKSP